MDCRRCHAKQKKEANKNNVRCDYLRVDCSPADGVEVYVRVCTLQSVNGHRREQDRNGIINLRKRFVDKIIVISLSCAPMRKGNVLNFIHA